MRKALVIDEVQDLASFVVGVFEYLDFDAFLAETVDDAIAILESDGYFEAVFITSPDEGGIDTIDLANRIAAHRPAIKIFICSKRIDRLRELPPCVFLAKPLNPRTLISAIEQTFRKRPAG